MCQSRQVALLGWCMCEWAWEWNYSLLSACVWVSGCVSLWDEEMKQRVAEWHPHQSADDDGDMYITNTTPKNGSTKQQRRVVLLTWRECLGERILSWDVRVSDGRVIHPFFKRRNHPACVSVNDEISFNLFSSICPYSVPHSRSSRGCVFDLSTICPEGLIDLVSPHPLFRDRKYHSRE